jgi:hypothetical protein
VGLPRDDSTDTGYVRGCSPKELIDDREAERWRAACAAKPMLRLYERVRSYELRYQESMLSRGQGWHRRANAQKPRAS